MTISIELLLIISGLIGMLTTTAITILLIVMPYIREKRKDEADRKEREDLEKLKQALMHKALDYDFTRDITAGQETTRYKDMLSRLKDHYGDFGEPTKP